MGVMLMVFGFKELCKNLVTIYNYFNTVEV